MWHLSTASWFSDKNWNQFIKFFHCIFQQARQGFCRSFQWRLIVFRPARPMDKQYRLFTGSQLFLLVFQLCSQSVTCSSHGSSTDSKSMFCLHDHYIKIHPPLQIEYRGFCRSLQKIFNDANARAAQFPGVIVEFTAHGAIFCNKIEYLMCFYFRLKTKTIISMRALFHIWLLSHFHLRCKYDFWHLILFRAGALQHITKFFSTVEWYFGTKILIPFCTCQKVSNAKIRRVLKYPSYMDDFEIVNSKKTWHPHT